MNQYGIFQMVIIDLKIFFSTQAYCGMRGHYGIKRVFFQNQYFISFPAHTMAVCYPENILDPWSCVTVNWQG